MKPLSSAMLSLDGKAETSDEARARRPAFAIRYCAIGRGLSVGGNFRCSSVNIFRLCRCIGRSLRISVYLSL